MPKPLNMVTIHGIGQTLKYDEYRRVCVILSTQFSISIVNLVNLNFDFDSIQIKTHLIENPKLLSYTHLCYGDADNTNFRFQCYNNVNPKIMLTWLVPEKSSQR